MPQDEHICAVEQLFEKSHEPDGHGKEEQLIGNGTMEHIHAAVFGLSLCVCHSPFLSVAAILPAFFPNPAKISAGLLPIP